MFAESVGERCPGTVVGQLRIWHECQSLEHELSKLDDASLFDLGLARAQISRFVSRFPIASEFLALLLERLELAGVAAPTLRWTYKDLLRTRPMCDEHCSCKERHLLEPMSKGDKDFCPNAWVLDQLRRSSYQHSIPFGAKSIGSHSEHLG